jgi:hypothetical protein
MSNFKIAPEFEALIPKLRVEEYEQLENSLRHDGCRDPLRVWEKENLLLDGHNRYRICEKWAICYGVTYLDFPNRDAAKLWIFDNQLGRRNVTDDQRVAIIKEAERLRANSPEGKKARTEAARQAKAEGKSVVRVSRMTENTNKALATKHNVPQHKLESMGTVCAAADKAPAGSPLKELPAKVRSGELKVAEARKIVTDSVDKPKPPGKRAQNKFNGRMDRVLPMFSGICHALADSDLTPEFTCSAEKAAQHLEMMLEFEEYIKIIIAKLRVRAATWTAPQVIETTEGIIQ